MQLKKCKPVDRNTPDSRQLISQNRTSSRVVWGAAIVFTLILFFVKLSTTAVLNYDGIFYLQVARRYWDQGFAQTMQFYSWPFYPILIAWGEQLTGFTARNSALLINLVFQVIMAVAFLGIIRRLRGNLVVQWFAVLIFIFFPPINHYRAYIIKDFGFWGCYLSALYFLLSYVQTLNWRYAVGWGIPMALAGLFRVEGFVFLFALPWVVWLLPGYTQFSQRVKAFFAVYSVGITLAIAIVLWLWMKPSHSLVQLGRFFQMLFVLEHGISFTLANLHSAALHMEQFVLSTDAKHGAMVLLLCGLFGFYFVKLFSVFGIVCTAFWGYGVYTRALCLTKAEKLTLNAVVIINVLISFYFLVNFLFVASRYVVALLFIPLLWTPFALAHLYQQWQRREKYRWLFPVALIGLLIMISIAFYRSDASKDYIKNAGDWLLKETLPQARLYTNSVRVLYYAKGTTADWPQGFDEQLKEIPTGKWNQYDYIAILSHEDPKKDDFPADTLSHFHLKPLKIFSNGDGKVTIYKVQ